MTTDAAHRAPPGQYRVISRDRDTGIETQERDFFDAQDAHGYCHETADDRPWITLTIYDDHGREVL